MELERQGAKVAKSSISKLSSENLKQKVKASKKAKSLKK